MKERLFKVFVIIAGLMLTTDSLAQLAPSYVGSAYSTGGDCYVITQNLQQQAGAAWYDNPIDLTEDFDIVFNGFFGSTDSGADGMAFVLKTTSAPVIGLPGEGLGYQQLPETQSLAVEFDTYQNSGATINDPFYDHIALHKNGNTNHSSPNSLTTYVQASATSTNIEDNIEHEVKIKWRAAEQTLIVIFDCNERINYSGDIINTVFGGSSTVYFGFTASTGNLTNQQSVCFQYLSFLESPLEDTTVCLGETVTGIDAFLPGATNYEWSPAAGVSDPNIANPTFTPDVTTTYTLTTTDNCGVVNQQSFTITVMPDPDVTITAADLTICNGEDAVFNLSGTPDSEITYTLNNGTEETILLDDTGIATITVAAPTSQQVVQLVEVALTNTPFCNANVTDSAAIDIIVEDASFSMTAQCLGATATITGDTGGTFTFNPLPTDGAIIDSATGTISEGTPGATYLVEYTLNAGCFTSSIEEVTLPILADYNAPLNVVLCDGDENDGFAEFDLNAVADQVTDGNADIVVTFYETETEAEDNNVVDQLPLAYTNADPFNQMIWVRIENSNTGCYTIESMEITVDPLPVVNGLNNITLCESNGSVDFDLTLAVNEILTTNPNTTISFYETDTDAETGDLATQLPLQYSTTALESQIWVRVENATASCYTVVALQLIQEPLPVLAQVDSIEGCDDDNDGFTTFDLTTVESQITVNNPNITLTYAYEDNGVLTAINSPAAFQNITTGSQTIWVSAENSLGCSTSVSFDIIVNTCLIQRGISPNSDGMNDSFDLTGFNVKEISVFNRYGVKVYTASNYINEWHGQSDNGNELPTGTYFYSMSYSNGNQVSAEQKTGWIYINREVN